ncbi:MAG: LON peptidase substrate-binding domain-containing protein [Planctomycetota bacterium]
MEDLSDVTRLPDDFDGTVRLFPLPELVLFPHAMQPLHIFEPRYCEMLEEALATDQLIAMATVAEMPSAPASVAQSIASIVCLGRIVSHSELEDDRHNILLVGTKRARVVQELDTGRTFRSAKVDVLHDVYPVEGAERRVALKQELLDAFGAIIPPSANVQQNLHELMAGQMGLGPITDIISYTLPFDLEDKLALLGYANVDDRATALVRLLESGKIELHSVSIEEQSLDANDLQFPGMPTKTDQSNDRFPPPFSLN